MVEQHLSFYIFFGGRSSPKILFNDPRMAHKNSDNSSRSRCCPSVWSWCWSAWVWSGPLVCHSAPRWCHQSTSTQHLDVNPSGVSYIVLQRYIHSIFCYTIVHYSTHDLYQVLILRSWLGPPCLCSSADHDQQELWKEVSTGKDLTSWSWYNLMPLVYQPVFLYSSYHRFSLGPIRPKVTKTKSFPWRLMGDFPPQVLGPWWRLNCLCCLEHWLLRTRLAGSLCGELVVHPEHAEVYEAGPEGQLKA